MDITVEPIQREIDPAIQPINRPVFRLPDTTIHDAYQYTPDEWRDRLCRLNPTAPYAIESERRVRRYVEDRGVDWDGWYYLFLASLPRRKVLVEETSYYERDLFCDGTTSEWRLVKLYTEDVDEYNQASLFGAEGVLEWGGDVTVGFKIDLDGYTQPLETSPKPVDDTGKEPVVTPVNVQEKDYTLGDEFFADIPVREVDPNTYVQLFTGTDLNYLIGDELPREALPHEFFSKNAGLDAERYKIVGIQATKVYDDRPTDRYTFRITVREMWKEDSFRE